MTPKDKLDNNLKITSSYDSQCNDHNLKIHQPHMTRWFGGRGPMGATPVSLGGILPDAGRSQALKPSSVQHLPTTTSRGDTFLIVSHLSYFGILLTLCQRGYSVWGYEEAEAVTKDDRDSWNQWNNLGKMPNLPWTKLAVQWELGDCTSHCLHAVQWICLP